MGSTQSPASSQKFSYIALSIGILSIGFSPILVRWADAPGVVTSFYRMGIGSIAMALPFLIRVRKAKNPMPLRGLIIAITGGFFFAMDLTLWTTGIKMNGATIPTLLGNTAPIFVGLGSFLFFKERQKPLFWVALILAMLGTAVILGIDLSQSSQVGLGALFSIIAAMFYAGYILITQRGRKYLDTLAYFWITTFSTAVFLLIISTLFGYSLAGYSGKTYFAFLLTGIVVQVIGWLTINYAQGYLPASLVSPSLLGQPIITAILANLFFGESFSTGTIIGGLMVLSGIFLVHQNN